MFYESCQNCGHCFIDLHCDRDLVVDLVPDRLASIALDLLVSEAGQQCCGIDLLLTLGAPEPQADTEGP